MVMKTLDRDSPSRRSRPGRRAQNVEDRHERDLRASALSTTMNGSEHPVEHRRQPQRHRDRPDADEHAAGEAHQRRVGPWPKRLVLDEAAVGEHPPERRRDGGKGVSSSASDSPNASVGRSPTGRRRPPGSRPARGGTMRGAPAEPGEIGRNRPGSARGRRAAAEARRVGRIPPAAASRERVRLSS